MATWFDDGDPAEQPVEDPPTVIHVPLLSLGRHSSNLHDGVSSGECGGVPYNPPAGRPVVPKASAGDGPAVAARGDVGDAVPGAANGNVPQGGQNNPLLIGRYRGETNLHLAGKYLPPRHNNKPDIRSVAPDVKEERTDDSPSAPEPAANDPEHEEEFPDAPPLAAPPLVLAPSRRAHPRLERPLEVCILMASLYRIINT